MSETSIRAADLPATESRDVPVELTPDVHWLVRLRWIAIAGVLIAAAISVRLNVVESVRPILIIAGAMFAFNTWLYVWLHDQPEGAAELGNARIVIPQLLFDLVALTVLLHFAGGAENPFAMFYAFHVAIGAVYLPRRTVWLIGLAAVLLQTGLVVGEFHGILSHHSLSFTAPPRLPPHPHRTPHDMYQMAEYITIYLCAFVLMLAGVIYLVHTVAERQRLADALRRQHERVAMSRQRLANIGEISTGLAHTIRNPLHGVINALEILRNKLDTTGVSADDMFALMTDGLERIERVTTRLLTLTRHSPLSIVATDVPLLVKETLRFIEARARESGVNVSIEVGSALPPVPLDPDRLFEALINLLDNALAACRPGDTISVKVARFRTSRNGVCIWVEDTGIGIPSEYVDKVFDPFFTTKPVGEGSGLGLAIAKRVVEEHAGELSIESVAGKGTRFRIFLPFTAPARSVDEAHHERTTPGAGG